ncbi:MAG TPA: ABC transporter permease [Candidatus Acidoferrum sp.]|jgi:predicted permease
MQNVWQDIRYALRTLAKNPGFAAVAIVTLALGIGANTAIFSVVNTVLLRPLPFQEPDRLMALWHTPPQTSFPGIPTFSVSPANFLDWRDQARSFEGMSAYGFGQYTLTGTGRPEAVRMVAATNGFFTILRAQPLFGRTFLEEEDSPGREHEVVLSYKLWRSRFGGDRDIVGKNISLNQQAFAVVGVMKPDFEFPISVDPAFSPQMWKPMAWTAQDRAVRDNHNYAVVARLKSGVSLQQARAELNSISNQLAQQHPGENKGWGATAIRLRDDLVGDVRPALLILLGAVALVLLIACANVANLLLAKALTRRKEIAIRAALGASRYRLLQQSISETLLVALAGGALGLIVAHYGVQLIVRFLAQQLPRSAEIGLDGWVLTFALGISLLTGIAVGLLSALRLAKNEVSESLKQGLGRTSSDSGGARTRSILVVSEVALSLVLLIGAGLLIRSLTVLRHVNPGFDPNQLLTLDIAIPSSKFSTPAQMATFFDSVLGRVRVLPGVQYAGLIDSLPLSGGGSHQPISVEGRPVVAMADQPEVDVRLISPGYISAMHIPLLSGRDLNESDIEGRPAAVLISQSMARLFWPNENPIGKHLTQYFFRETPRVVVGVVADVKLDALNETRPVPTLYTSLAQVSPSTGETWRSFGMSLAVRTSGDPLNVVAMITNSVHEVDTEVPLLNIHPMDETVSASLSPQRFTMLLLAAFAGTALLLAAAGIYGVMAYVVTRRTREIGVRMALGAATGDVFRLVVGQGMWTTGIGLAIGIVGSIALARTMQSLLFGVGPTDPMTLLGVVLLLGAVSFLACWIPARRAMRVDPLVALRDE